MTDNRKKKFLEELSKAQSVSAAARSCAVSRTALYNLRENDSEFAAAWDDAIEQGVDALEDEAVRRALSSSDTLMIFLLKGARPEKYRETTRNVNVNVTPEQAAQMSDAELDAELKRRGLS